ncbi:hypothetical protein I7I52_00623 [Histoplasma capsulatum]|uniref:Uncharacterized protein n=1 Tax=Ajellomyces capsulatus TaxID=5037 RepID=A0A8H8D6J4_AJECA|nr:hypothetical protein I7I52_00623 [Histoplasma capsulatum]
MFQSHVPGSFPVCVRKIKKKKKINSRERLVNQPRDFPSISSTSSISTAHGPGVRLHLINQSINIFASLRHSRIAEYNQGMKKKKASIHPLLSLGGLCFWGFVCDWSYTL